MPEEKRRFTRVRFNMAAELTVNNNVISFSSVENLSVGGCLLVTTVRLEVGANCLFWLPLEHENPDLGVEVFGEIARCNGESVSVRFTKITPESLFLLHNIIRFNAPDPDKIDNEISEHPGIM
jgi:hypothetical protein